MKTRALVTLTLGLLFAIGATAQVTASGTLAVTGTVQGTVQMTFVSGTGGVPLGNSGSSAATLAFGPVSMNSTLTGATITPGSGSWTIESPVGIKVNGANIGSSSYTLKAQLASADANFTYKVGPASGTLVSVVNGSDATVATGVGYSDTAAQYNVQVTILNSVADGTGLNKTINFTATSE